MNRAGLYVIFWGAKGAGRSGCTNFFCRSSLAMPGQTGLQGFVSSDLAGSRQPTQQFRGSCLRRVELRTSILSSRTGANRSEEQGTTGGAAVGDPRIFQQSTALLRSTRCSTSAPAVR